VDLEILTAYKIVVHYRYGGHGAGRAGREEDYFHHWETFLDWYQEKFFPVEE